MLVSLVPAGTSWSQLVLSHRDGNRRLLLRLPQQIPLFRPKKHLHQVVCLHALLWGRPTG